MNVPIFFIRLSTNMLSFFEVNVKFEITMCERAHAMLCYAMGSVLRFMFMMGGFGDAMLCYVFMIRRFGNMPPMLWSCLCYVFSVRAWILQLLSLWLHRRRDSQRGWRCRGRACFRSCHTVSSKSWQSNWRFDFSRLWSVLIGTVRLSRGSVDESWKCCSFFLWVSPEILHVKINAFIVRLIQPEIIAPWSDVA